MPKLSIITINYNNLKGLQQTVNSVSTQTFTDFEYIIIDGGSSDSSGEFIKQNIYKLSYWIIENDAGIYDAMNKGILKAKGDFILFLNSGDLFCNEHVLKNCNLPSQDYDILYGDIFNIYNNRKELREFNHKLDFEYMANGTLCHNSTFIRRKLFSEIGLYDLNYKIVSDWHFFMKVLFRHNGSHIHLTLPVIDYDRNGFSSLAQNQIFLKKERSEILLSEYKHEMDLYQQLIAERNKFTRIMNKPVLKQFSSVKIALAKLFNFLR